MISVYEIFQFDFATSLTFSYRSNLLMAYGAYWLFLAFLSENFGKVVGTHQCYFAILQCMNAG